MSNPTPPSRILNFLSDDDGAAPIDYAVMLTLIVIACINIVAELGHSVSGTFDKLNTALGS